LNVSDITGFHVYLPTSGFVGFALFILESAEKSPSFFSRSVSSIPLIQNQWHECDDFSKNQILSRADPRRRIRLLLSSSDLALVLMHLSVIMPKVICVFCLISYLMGKKKKKKFFFFVFSLMNLQRKV